MEETFPTLWAHYLAQGYFDMQQWGDSYIEPPTNGQLDDPLYFLIHSRP